jgi:L-alanine-DL-glutamate epimerase-like enolase superfamily enzyme
MTAVISGIKTTPVIVPFRRPPVTASGAVNELPLVLLDLETDAGLIGRAYLFVKADHGLCGCDRRAGTGYER